MNVCLYYDSISRASVIFPLCAAHGLCGFPKIGLPRDPLLSAHRGPSKQGDTSGWPPGMLEGQDSGDKEWIKGQNKHKHKGNFPVSLEDSNFFVLACHSFSLNKVKDINIKKDWEVDCMRQCLYSLCVRDSLLLNKYWSAVWNHVESMRTLITSSHTGIEAFEVFNKCY